MAVLITKPLKRPKHKKIKKSDEQISITIMSKEEKRQRAIELEQFFAEHRKEGKVEEPSKQSPPSIGRRKYKESEIGSIAIADKIEIIRSNAFLNCKYLKCVFFNETSQIKIIEKNAFRGCTKLKEIVFPKKKISVYGVEIDFTTLSQEKISELITIITKPIAIKKPQKRIRKKEERTIRYCQTITKKEAKGRHHHWYRPK